MIKKWDKFNEGLDDEKIKRIRGVYNKLILNNDPNQPGIVGWRTYNNQEARFKVLFKYIKPGDKILDYGCGVGDMSKFIKDMDLDYTGIDINPNMIEMAEEKYPDQKFYSMNSAFDFEKYDYDWFLASGVFSNYMNEVEMISVVKPAFEKSNKGLGINFLISNKDTPEFEGYLRGYNPEKLLELFKKEITPNVELIKGYAIDDFTLILKK